MSPISRSDIRRRAGLTQLQLAKLVGSSAPQICVWERGDKELPVETVARIAVVLFDHLKEVPAFDGTDDLARILAPSAFAANPESRGVR